MKEEIAIYCDGSSLGNPGPGGWGVVVIRSAEEVEEYGGREEYTTNNRMELTAAINALARVGLGESAILHTDSIYVVKGIQEWVHTWMKNGWKTANKKPVENIGLWQKLMEAAEGKDIAWVHVRGHSGVRWNERADAIARSYAELGTMPP